MDLEIPKRLRIRGGNGHDVDRDEEQLEMNAGKLTVDSIGRIVKIIAWTIGIAMSGVTGWYAMQSRVDAATVGVQRVEQRVDRIEQQHEKSDAAAAQTVTTMAVIGEQLKTLNDHLKDLDDRIERIELRQTGEVIPAPRRKHHQ